MVHPASLKQNELLEESTVTRTRRGGPGGQHRNKTSTAVVIIHDSTKVASSASERRSQHQNLAQAVWRLRINLALAVREPAPPDREPSLIWQSRTRNGRIAVSASSDDFPTVLAEVLDFVSAECGEMNAAAARLHVTPSQLLKFVRLEPAAWLWLSAIRKRMGKRPLH